MGEVLRYLGVAVVGLLAGAALYAYGPMLVQTGDASAPANLVPVSTGIDTSAQPSAAQLAALGERGYGLVVNLTPPGDFAFEPREGALVSAGGASYVHIPVDWHAPSPQDWRLFADVLDAAGERRVLVHCQVNRRASVFTFLYAVIRAGHPVDEAIERVHAVWAPDAGWRAFMGEVLAAHGIEPPL